MHFGIRAILLIANCVGNHVLATWLRRRYGQDRLTRIFSWSVHSYAGHSWLTFGLAIAPDLAFATAWWRSFFPVWFFNIVLMLHFTMAYCGHEGRASKALLRAFYAGAAVCSVLGVLNLYPVVLIVRPDMVWDVDPLKNPFMFKFCVPFLLLVFLVCVAHAAWRVHSVRGKKGLKAPAWLILFALLAHFIVSTFIVSGVATWIGTFDVSV